MVLEQIVSIEWLRRRPLYAIFLGLTYTFIAAITGYLFFKDKFSVSLLFLVTLLLVPSLINLLSFEEEKERSDGVKRFFQNHKSIFEIYLFLSVGVFIAYILVIFFLGASGLGLSTTVGEQMKVLGGEITIEQIKNFETNPLVHSLNLFVNNLGVAVIFFLLSFFYGAGAIFLMVWNASIFATFVSLTIKNIGKGVEHGFLLLGTFSMYIIPEIAGFLLAAIAGGVISKAVIVEEFMSNSFKNVVKDAIVLLLCSIVILLIAAFLEGYIGVELIKALV